jgi:septal ring factor EnvC (AmiA/AmiB activator)
MKQFVFLLIVLLSGLILRSILRTNMIEGLAPCSPDEQSLAYKNTAAIEQQQKDLSDYEAGIESQIKMLEGEISQFAQLIAANTAAIGANTKGIQASAKKIKKAADKKEKELDKYSF